MPTLSASLVNLNIATVGVVEEALARQVMYGGDLATNLFELTDVDEAALIQALAQSHDLPPAPSGPLPSAPDEWRRLLPGDLAERYGLFPFLEEQALLHVAVSEPLPGEVEQDLAFSLGVSIVQHAAPLVRIQEAIARDYQQPLDPRIERILAKLTGSSTGEAPSIHGPRIGFSSLPKPESLPPKAYAHTSPEPSQHPPDINSEMVATAPPPVGYPTGKASPDGHSTVPAPGAAEPSELVACEAPTDSARVGHATLLRHKAAALARAEQLQKETRSRHLGPYTAANAEHDLLQARTRDEVLCCLFDFCAQYFEYSALFVLHADIAEGREARGPGATREQVRRIGVPLDLPSSLRQTRDAGKWHLSRLQKTGLDASLAKDLGRQTGRKVLFLPVVVRKRTILVLYGDHGAHDVILESVGDVISFAPLAAAGFERVIVRMKGGSRNPSLPPEPARERTKNKRPSRAERAQALAEVLESVAPGPSRAPAPPRQEKQDTLKPVVNKAPIAEPSALRRPEAPEWTSPASGSLKPRPMVSIEPPKVVPSKVTTTLPPLSDEPPEAGWDDDAEPSAVGSARARLEPLQLPEEINPQPDGVTPKISVGPARLDPELEQLLAEEEGVPLAPESHSIAYSARPLARPGDAEELRLPSVMVDKHSSTEELMHRLLEGDPQAERLLAELPSPEAARAVATCLIDGEVQVRQAASMAARKLARHPQLRASLRRELGDVALDPSQTDNVRHCAIEALTETRDPLVVPLMTGLLDDSSGDIARSAQWGLVVLCRADCGQDRTAWQAWWDRNKDRHRVEWLIDALTHDNADIRRTAGDELKAVTKEYFGYYDDLPKKERASAQDRYRKWWETTGIGLFR